MADAEIKVGADATAVERAMAVGKAAVQDFSTSIKSSIGSAAQAVITDMGNIALSMGKVNFSSQRDQVRSFEASSARLAVAMGRDLESVRTSLEATGRAIGKRPAEVAAWQAELGKLGYSFDGALDSMKAMSGLAASTGRTTEDYRGLAVQLTQMGVAGKDTSKVLGVMKAQADALHTTGGVAALADSFESLGDVVNRFSDRSTSGIAKLTGLIGTLGKDLDAVSQKKVASQALNALASDTMGWERYLGHSIIDKHGKVANPEKALEEITNKIKRTYGKDASRMLRLQFGDELGMSLYNADFKEAAKVSGLLPSTDLAKKQQTYLNTDAGRRDIETSNLDISSRNLMGSSTLLGRAADALQKFAASSPVSSTMITGAITGAFGTFMGTLGTSIAKMMGQKGQAGAVGGLIDLATKGKGAVPIKGALGTLGAAGLAATGLYAAYNAVQEEGGFGAVGNAVSDVFNGSTPAVASGDNRKHATQVAQNKQNLALAGLKATGAIMDTLGIGGMGLSDTDVAKLAQALSSALKSTPIQVQSSPDTPVTAAFKESNSSSAGNQSL
jgi:hypothetical protein